MRRFTSAITRIPSRSIVNALSLQPNLPKPNYERALQEHAAYVKGLKAMGLAVTVCAADERFPDGNFVEDAFLFLGESLMLELNPGAPTRTGEPMSLTPYLPRQIPRKTLNKRYTIDGGDILVDGKVIYIGLSQRTQEEAIVELERWVKEIGYQVVRVAVPEGLHLKSGMTVMQPNHFIIQAAFVPELIKLQSSNPNLQYYVVSPEENHAANVLPINGKIMIPTGCPKAKAYIERLYQATDIIEMDTSEVRLVDGALTCSSLIY